MSTGYSGNLGFTLPENWAYDQISTITLGSGDGLIEIDNNIQSGLDSGASSVDESYTKPTNLDDYYLYESQKSDLIKEVSNCVEELMELYQDLKSVRSPEDAANLVYDNDKVITNLSNKYKIRKALIQTVFMWEASAEGIDDTASDAAVVSYYTYMEALEEWQNLSPEEQLIVTMPTPPVIIKTDSSTGYCQIFASTAISAYNYAIDNNIISGDKYNYDDWHDVWNVWSNLHNDPEYCISMCALVLIHAAHLVGLDTDYYGYSTAEIKKVIARYNGTGDAAASYGERNYAIYEIFEKYNKQVR